ncbi:hypothetical protein PG994_000758 [Apiospora phragmitis]|uniref:Uncharacterized protein n=1 Tax=Apiospora phragmitis TaxID=2905665 RepID=A0ABR1X738_9PEZI
MDDLKRQMDACIGGCTVGKAWYAIWGDVVAFTCAGAGLQAMIQRGAAHHRRLQALHGGHHSLGAQRQRPALPHLGLHGLLPGARLLRRRPVVRGDQLQGLRPSVERSDWGNEENKAVMEWGMGVL